MNQEEKYNFCAHVIGEHHSRISWQLDDGCRTRSTWRTTVDLKSIFSYSCIWQPNGWRYKIGVIVKYVGVIKFYLTVVEKISNHSPPGGNSWWCIFLGWATVPCLHGCHLETIDHRKIMSKILQWIMTSRLHTKNFRAVACIFDF